MIQHIFAQNVGDNSSCSRSFVTLICHAIYQNSTSRNWYQIGLNVRIKDQNIKKRMNNIANTREDTDWQTWKTSKRVAIVGF